MSKGSIYFASPYGFAESTFRFMEELDELMTREGYRVLNPWKMAGTEMVEEMTRLRKSVSPEHRGRLHDLNMTIGETNENLIVDSDIVVAALDGIDVDSGTASEIGFAYAKGKRIIGYRGDSRLTGDNEGVTVNLQVQYWIEKSGGKIVDSVEALVNTIGELLE